MKYVHIHHSKELETDEKPKVEKNEEEISQNGEDEIIDGEDNKKDEESNKESIQEVKNEIQDNYSELADQQLEETDALGEEGVDEDFSEEESETSQVAAKEQGSVEEIQEELPENVESTEKPPDSSEEVDPIHEESEVIEKVQESYENLQPAEVWPDLLLIVRLLSLFVLTAGAPKVDLRVGSSLILLILIVVSRKPSYFTINLTIFCRMLIFNAFWVDWTLKIMPSIFTGPIFIISVN